MRRSALRHLSCLPSVAILGGLAAGLSGSACSHQTTPTGDLGSPSATSVDALVFVKRQHTLLDANGNVQSIDVAGGAGQVIDYQRYVPGGGVYYLSPARPDGKLTNLTAAFPEADVAGLDLSFDAREIVFSMKKNGSDDYHIYTMDIGGGEPHQKTFGRGFDDINPIYVPGGRIAFATNQMYTDMGTRADEYNHGRAVVQLAIITSDGGDGDRKLCSQNLSHTVNPFLRFDGSIGYSRWEHLGGVNDVKLFRMAPDCTQMIHVAGQFGKNFNSLVQMTEISPNVMVGIATDRERTIQAGAIVRVDSRFVKDDQSPDALRLDPEHVSYDILTPGVPTGSDDSPLGRYRNPRALPDGRIITSWADGTVNDKNELGLTPPDFGIWIYDTGSRKNQLVYNDKDTWDLYPIAVTSRTEPPVIGSVQNTVDATTPARIGSVDIKLTDLGDNDVTTSQYYPTLDEMSHTTVKLGEALTTATAVRVIEGFSSEAATGVTMFGLTMDEGANILGEATVRGDGSWLADVPPYVPMHLQPIDKYGMSVRNQRLWIQGMPGESRVCGGCHESRTGNNVLGAGQNPTASSTIGPEKFSASIQDRIVVPTTVTTANASVGEYPWDLRIQRIFNDNNCTGCHNTTTNGSKAQSFYTFSKTPVGGGMAAVYQIPTLDLTDTPVTVYYDRGVHTWSSSYVSIFFPATMKMSMAEGGMVTGTVPPAWGVPESARESVLIEKLNVRAPDGTWAWDTATHPPHPEDVGGTLSDADRAMLVRAMDLGGQYYSRANTGFLPNTNDAVGTKY